jgi:hypothetical protein
MPICVYDKGQLLRSNSAKTQRNLRQRSMLILEETSSGQPRRTIEHVQRHTSLQDVQQLREAWGCDQRLP